MTNPNNRTRLSDLQNLGPRGLQCPKCGCRHLHVIYTRETIQNRLRRRRECRNCGHRITTYEQSFS